MAGYKLIRGRSENGEIDVNIQIHKRCEFRDVRFNGSHAMPSSPIDVVAVYLDRGERDRLTRGGIFYLKFVPASGRYVFKSASCSLVGCIEGNPTDRYTRNGRKVTYVRGQPELMGGPIQREVVPWETLRKEPIFQTTVTKHKPTSRSGHQTILIRNLTDYIMP